jgi:uncharacterized protein (TIGR00297 family)
MIYEIDTIEQTIKSRGRGLLVWIVGLIASSFMAITAYWKDSLSKSGVVGAIGVGTLIIGGTGWAGFLILAFFFVTSSGFSKWSSRDEDSSIVVKGGQRDIIQVLANGGIASVGALLYTLTDDSLWIIVLSSSLAAATSDTWASEIGRLSRSAPRDVFTWKKVKPGTSGAITGLGTLASFLGASLTALVSIPLLIQVQLSIQMIVLLSVITFSGWLGNWVDTWVGAKWQIRYQCATCLQVTENKRHCQQSTKQIRGVFWLDNDMVNVSCTFAAGVVSGIIVVLMRIL